MNKRNKAREQVFWNSSHLGKWAILGPKIVHSHNCRFAHPHNSGSTRRILFTFCTIKGSKRQMRMIVIIFQNKIGGKWTILGPKIVHCYNSGSAVKKFLNFAQWKRQIGRWKQWQWFLPKNFCLGQMDHFGPENGAYRFNSESTLRLF